MYIVITRYEVRKMKLKMTGEILLLPFFKLAKWFKQIRTRKSACTIIPENQLWNKVKTYFKSFDLIVSKNGTEKNERRISFVFIGDISSQILKRIITIFMKVVASK